MRATTISTRHRGGGGGARWAHRLGLVVAMAALALVPGRAAADGTPEQPVTHSLGVALTFPDAGLTEGEQLCLALYAGEGGDLAATSPLQSTCLGPGETSALFEGLSHGAYRVVVPAPGSALGLQRYQGQIVATGVPDEPNLNAYGIDVNLALAPEVAGTTGSVQVNVYGCPPGTNGGGDATVWASQCEYVAGKVPLTLQGIGSIDDTTVTAVTGHEGEESGRVEFANLPAGAYRLDGQLPENVAADAAYFVVSSVDGSTTTLDPSGTVAVRPAEIKTIDVYLVLAPEDDASAPEPAAPAAPGGPADPGIGDVSNGPGASVGLAAPAVTGGVPAEIAVPPAASPARTRPWVVRLPNTGAGAATGGEVTVAAAAGLGLLLVGWGGLVGRRRRRGAAGRLS